MFENDRQRTSDLSTAAVAGAHISNPPLLLLTSRAQRATARTYIDTLIHE